MRKVILALVLAVLLSTPALAASIGLNMSVATIGEVEPGGTVDITATVDANDHFPGEEQDVRLTMYADGEAVATETVHVTRDSGASHTFQPQFSEVGDHEVTISAEYADAPEQGATNTTVTITVTDDPLKPDTSDAAEGEAEQRQDCLSEAKETMWDFKTRFQCDGYFGTLFSDLLDALDDLFGGLF